MKIKMIVPIIIILFFLSFLGWLGDKFSILSKSSTQLTQNIPSASPAPEVPVNTDTRSLKTEAKVARVIDGDTIEASISGKIETIRLIGINTPETVDPRTIVECFGVESSNKAKEILTGKTIFLETDPTQGERDKYQRLLRYVWLDANISFNKKMISDGYAYEYTYNIPYKYQEEYKQAEKEARENKRGLWADNTCAGNLVKATATSNTNPATGNIPSPTTTQTTGTSTSNSGTCKYSCSSPDRDCSNFTTHTAAQTFFDCCGFTATYDPMKLDSTGIGDGVACESLP